MLRIFLLLLSFSSCSVGCDIESWLNQYAHDTVITPTGSELEAMEQAFSQLLDGMVEEQAWMRLGYQIQRCGSQSVFLPDKPNGWGVVAVDSASDSRRILQVPHQYYDRGTGQIGLSLFKQGKARLVQWNNVVRYHDKQVASLSDMTKARRSSFTALALAIARHEQSWQLMQLHGFSEAKRQESRAKKAEIIISDGSYAPGAEMFNLQRCWHNHYATLLFPENTRELGGTKNPSKAVLYQHRLLDHRLSQFLHIELSSSMRQQLKSTEVFKQWSDCL